MKTVFPLAATLFLALPLVTLETPVQAQPADSCGTKSGLCWPKLRRGQHGYQTKALQSLLTAQGMKLGADGVFGTSTSKAVLAFQKKRGLKTDGIAGWQTWEALVPSLGRGSKGASVVALQRLLNGHDYQLRNDGVFGATTEKAVKGFQTDNSIDPANGRPTASVWCLLLGGDFDGEGG